VPPVAGAGQSTRQVRRDHLPSLRSFLTDQRHADLLGLWPTSGDYTQKDSRITKNSNIRLAWSRPGTPPGSPALRDDVFLAQ
jgi:hypothetical protein